MFLNKAKKGFGWYIAVKKDSKGQETEQPMYVNFTFKRDCEPTNLNDKGSYDADLYLIDKQGNRRRVFPYINEWGDHRSVEFKIMDVEEAQKLDVNVKIGPEELPFY